VGLLTVLITICAAGPWLLANPACSTHGPPNSGIEGQVSIGPISPVSRPDEANTQPFVADLQVRRASDGRVVATVRSRKDDAFRVALAPSRYHLEPQPGKPFPTASTQDVIAVDGEFTRVQVDCDSGIR
jgi:hypothetical protein